MELAVVFAVVSDAVVLLSIDVEDIGVPLVSDVEDMVVTITTGMEVIVVMVLLSLVVDSAVLVVLVSAVVAVAIFELDLTQQYENIEATPLCSRVRITQTSRNHFPLSTVNLPREMCNGVTNIRFH